MKKRASLIFFFIIFLALTLRIFNLAQIPSGFYNDETLVGYEAYSILETGKDQYGNSFPIAFKAFGDYRPGLYIYSIVPFIEAFGLNEFAVRLPSALFSTALIIVTYFIALELFTKKRIALLASLWLSIVPFSIQFGRMAHDTNPATLLMALGILIYLKSRKNIKLLPLSAVILFLSLYVYYTTRVIVPIFAAYFLIKDYKWLLKNLKTSLISLILSVVIVSPIIYSFLVSPGAFFSRADHVSLWGDRGLTASIIGNTTEDSYDNITKLPRIYHNKFSQGFIVVTKSFLNHFNLDFLIFEGDLDQIYKVPSFGIIYILDIILIIIGLIVLFKYKKITGFVIFWLIVGLIPDTLTRFSPTASRIHFILPVLAILIALSINYLFNKLNKPLFILVTLLYLFFFSFYLHQYFLHMGIRYAKEWHYGLKQIVVEVDRKKYCYDKIWISKTLWGWINFAFFLEYPPQQMQKEIELKDINQYGIGWVYDFDKYHFDYLPGDLTGHKKTLFIGEPGDFSAKDKPIPDKIIYFPDKTEAYYMVSSDDVDCN